MLYVAIILYVNFRGITFYETSQVSCRGGAFPGKGSYSECHYIWKILYKCATIDVWEWINSFSPYFTGHVITYPWLELSNTWEFQVCAIICPCDVKWKKQFSSVLWFVYYDLKLVGAFHMINCTFCVEFNILPCIYFTLLCQVMLHFYQASLVVFHAPKYLSLHMYWHIHCCICLAIFHMTWKLTSLISVSAKSLYHLMYEQSNWAPFYLHGLTLIPVWISNHMPTWSVPAQTIETLVIWDAIALLMTSM